MLTLYIEDDCAYTAAVLHKIDDLGLVVEQKNIKDEGVREELIERGGKDQTPYLYDDERNVSLYESAVITNYLERTYEKTDEAV